jgi:hypothetical protein
MAKAIPTSSAFMPISPELLGVVWGSLAPNAVTAVTEMAFGRIAANIAKLPELLQSASKDSVADA